MHTDHTLQGTVFYCFKMLGGESLSSFYTGLAIRSHQCIFNPGGVIVCTGFVHILGDAVYVGMYYSYLGCVGVWVCFWLPR